MDGSWKSNIRERMGGTVLHFTHILDHNSLEEKSTAGFNQIALGQMAVPF